MATRPPLSPARSWWAMFIFMIALMFNFLDRQVMSLLITPIKKDFHLSDTQIGLLTGFAFVTFYVLLGIPLSRLVDRGPRKWILGGALTFWSLMTAACGLAANVWQLTVARMLVGAGESCNAPGAYSMTSDMFRREKLAAPMSVISIGTVAGSGMALLVGAIVIKWLNHVGPQTFPVVGALKPWQMTFIIVSLPGVLWAILMLATVPEPPRHAAAGTRAPGSAEVVRHLWARRDAYLPMFLAYAIKAMLSFGVTAWAPVFFERRFGYAPGEPGLPIGLISLIVSPLGLLLGGWWAQRMYAAGRTDANMRVVYLVTLPLIPASILFPMMPTDTLALAVLGVSLFLGSVGNGPANTAIQTITPGRMRGMTTAIYIAIYNMIGYGVGPLVVGWCNDHLFGEAGIASSMVVLAAISGPLGLICAWLSLKPYTREIMAAEARGE